MSEKFTKARFWKCALQVNPSGYIAYRGTDHSLTEEQYNLELVKNAKVSDIKIIGLADHGNVDAVDIIRDLMSKNDIITFPGFEISSSEKIHFVCLFSESTTKDQLHRYLGNLELTDTQDGVRPSKLSAEQLLQKIDDLGGFAYAAHCTSDCGVLQKKFHHIWKNPALKAAQIPGTLDCLKGFEDDFYRKVILNKIPEYYREVPIAFINAKDIAVPGDLSDAHSSCLIKMTKPDFQSFKLAFQDPDSRVRLNSDVVEKYYSRIENLKVTGGYLDSLQIDFSEHLNAIIGGRGTGKSTLIEFIRYALELNPISKNSQRQHEEIIKENIGRSKGRIELTIRSSRMNGKVFTIARRYGESVVVKDQDGAISSFVPSDLLPEIEVYGQNEIYEIAQDSAGHKRFISRFLEEIDGNEKKINEAIHKLKENRKSLIEANKNVSLIEDEVARLPKLLERVNQFKTFGLEEKLKIIPKLENEKRLQSRVKEDIKTLETGLTVLSDSFPDVTFLSDAVIEALPHAEVLRKIRLELEKLLGQTVSSFSQLKTSLDNQKTALAIYHAELNKLIIEEEVKIESTFKELPSCEGRSGKEIGIEYQNILKEVERIRPKEILLTNRKEIVTELLQRRRSLLDELSSNRAERTSQLEKAVKKLNKKLDGKLKLSVDPESDRTPLIRNLIECNLESIGEKRLEWIKTANDFSPVKLAELIAKGPESLKNANWGITPTVVDALVRINLSQRLEIEELELPDIVKIELNVAHTGADNFRPIEKLSTGQQCTAVLHLLLLSSLDPLIIDQPEDNLDNAFIADRIVTELRIAKIARQFIFATHNANIPVFGDAEWIGVFSADADHAEIPVDLQGAIDVPQIKNSAAEILEGGKNAFNQRKAKYGF